MKDFVMSGASNPKDGNLIPSTTSPSSKAIKMSPGAQVMAGTQLQGRFTVTSTRKPASGTQVKSVISINQNRQSN